MERAETVNVRGLTKRYGRTLALNDVSFQLYEGDIFGFIGPNGAGKTTTLRILATNLRPDSGEAILAGCHLSGDIYKVRAVIGFMPDFMGIYDNLTVSDYLEFFARAYHLPPHLQAYAIKEVAALTMIEKHLAQPVEALSRGMKQRLCLAKTLLHNPKILLLDEPASGLDPRARIELKDIIKRLQTQNRTIIISSHILSDLADLCNKVGIIEHGKMVIMDEMDNLLRRISGERKIRLRTLSDREEARIILTECRGVSEIVWDGEDLLFTFSGDDSGLHELLGSLMEKGVRVYNFSEISDSLERIYMKLIEHEECASMTD